MPRRRALRQRVTCASSAALGTSSLSPLLPPGHAARLRALALEKALQTVELLVPERGELLDRGARGLERARIESTPVQAAFLPSRQELRLVQHANVFGDSGQAHVEVARELRNGAISVRRVPQD